MDKALHDQINNLIDKSQKILLLTHAKADCDGLGAALSTYLVLKELGKEPVVATNDPAADNMKFLPSIDILQNSLSGSSDFIITLDTSETSISKVKYNSKGNQFNIIITPKEGRFIPDHVSFEHGTANYDLIMVFDSGNLEHLGPLYDKNAEMFFKTPVINIDHHASNTDFGQVNLVDVTAASTTEVLYEFLADLEKKHNKKLITKDIATLLLAGLITDTGSFQHANTSPRSMETAAKLLDLGGRQQEIIKNIYKTKKLSTLKLWGIILSKVKVDPVYRMVWSTINEDDLMEADANSEETEGIIDDLLTNAPGAEVIFLIKHNEEGYVSVSFRSTTNAADVGKLCAENGGGGHVRAAGFKVRDGRPFEEIASEVLEKVRKFQAERLNIHPESLEDEKKIEAKKMEMPIQKSADDTAMPPTPKGGQEGNAVGAQDPAPKEAKPQKATYLKFKAPSEKPAKTPDDMAKPSGGGAEMSYDASSDKKVEDKPRETTYLEFKTPSAPASPAPKKPSGGAEMSYDASSDKPKEVRLKGPIAVPEELKVTADNEPKLDKPVEPVWSEAEKTKAEGDRDPGKPRKRRRRRRKPAKSANSGASDAPAPPPPSV